MSPSIDSDDVDLEKLYASAKNLMRRIIEHASSNILELDADVRLTHYLRRKLGEQQFDLANGEDVKLTPASEVGVGTAVEDEKKSLLEIVKRPL